MSQNLKLHHHILNQILLLNLPIIDSYQVQQLYHNNLY